MQSSLRNWLKISFFNLLLVSFIGIILRYKIAFSLPFIDQKHLLHGHSHFAFTGWITNTLLVLMVQYLSRKTSEDVFKKYRFLLYANLLTAYGMLISFPLQGYGFWSISFSTLSIITSYLFAIKYWKDLNSIPSENHSHLWFKAALIFGSLSSLGAFALAIMMGAKIIHQNWYLIAVYFFLHFQYNGWFFFAGMGLLFARMESSIHLQKNFRIIFYLFCGACFPAYLLSVLWLPMPISIYWIVVLAALAQIVGWIWLIWIINSTKPSFVTNFPVTGKWLLLLSSVALTIKLFLQLGSTIPTLSQLAFGFRPIVIGYLHLVLLGIISLFLIGYIISFQLIKPTKLLLSGIYILVAGIIINEFLLMSQGTAALSYHIIPFINEGLLVAALIMFSGILLINLSKPTASPD